MATFVSLPFIAFCWLVIFSFLQHADVSLAGHAFQRRSSRLQSLGTNQKTRLLSHRDLWVAASINIRGGGDSDDEDDEEDEEEEPEKAAAVGVESESEIDDDVDDSEIDALIADVDEEVDALLTASAVKASMKSEGKKASEKIKSVKKVVNAKLADKASETGDEPTFVAKKKKSSKSLLKLFRVPYIIRASLNPVTLWKMTAAYWASLFNLDYLKQDSSQDLRSALEEKSKKGGFSSPRGNRKMKRGQAKTLSDLPQLSS